MRLKLGIIIELCGSRRAGIELPHLCVCLSWLSKVAKLRETRDSFFAEAEGLYARVPWHRLSGWGKKRKRVCPLLGGRSIDSCAKGLEKYRLASYDDGGK